MIKLSMVRHGQTNYNLNLLVQGRINIPLNKNGRQQAHDLAEILYEENKQFDAILSSPLSRALETASIIAKKLDYTKPIEIIQHFIERDFSSLDGQGVELSRRLLREKNLVDDHFEQDDALIHRIVKAALNLQNNHDGETLLCVAHSHVIKALLVYCNPKEITFADYLLMNGDVITFEIEQNHIRFIEHMKHPNGHLK